MKLLLVDSCISQRGADSRTGALCRAFLETYQEIHPAVEIETVALESLNLRPLNRAMLDQRDALANAGSFDAPIFDLARQFRDADRVVVAAPFWDLTFPAALRVYIEHICASGVAYHYTAGGCHGDCKAQRLVFLTTGGDVERQPSLGVLYWEQLCRMFGIGRFDYVFAGGLDLDPDKAPALLAHACAQARRLAAEF